MPLALVDRTGVAGTLIAWPLTAILTVGTTGRIIFFFFLLLPLEVITTPLSNRTRKTAFLAMHESTQLRIILAGGATNYFFLHYFFLHLNTSKPYFFNIILQDNTIQIIFLLTTLNYLLLRTKTYLILGFDFD